MRMRVTAIGATASIAGLEPDGTVIVTVRPWWSSTRVERGGRSVFRDDLAGLNLSTRPAILVELGNMRNNSDAALQVDPGFRQQLAEALARGLEAFLRVRQ